MEVDFADLVRRIRRVRGQTQEDLARDLDVTVGTMNGWENGKHRPIKAQQRRLITLAQEMKIILSRRDTPTRPAENITQNRKVSGRTRHD